LSNYYNINNYLGFRCAVFFYHAPLSKDI